ncbi:MAG TPA: hypothetical protein VFS94_02365 [Gemmatimonadales bacterium]|nr:hypothetical protein [Gemmatimonadales bacterium]
MFNLIENPVVPLTDTVPFLSGEFFRARWSRVMREGLDAGNDAPPVFQRYLLEFPGR